MAGPLIRFSCSCGKRVAAPAKYAGRSAQCPKCQKTIVVPAGNPTEDVPKSSSTQKPQQCDHPQLNDFYSIVLKEFEGKIIHHEVTAGAPSFRFQLPDRRTQTILMSVEKDDRDREWLVLSSEIGTITLFEETMKALRLNRRVSSGRLYLDEYQVLQLEHRSRLDELDEKEVVKTVKAVARWADEFEEELFVIDIR